MTDAREREDGPGNFIRDIIAADVAAGKHGGRVHTRFPPEPNGYLHIGHARAIHIDFGLAQEFGGQCNLRLDDTNPVKEDEDYVDAIEEDVRWLGYDWGDRKFYASDYFERLYAFALELVDQGLAYVDSQTEDEIRQNRGSFHDKGTDSPFRERSVEDNRALLAQMRGGELPDGACVLRAKIDMQSPNIVMRDPIIYRIRHVHHHRTGDAWCIYPMYDFAHGLSDAIEGITHSLCSLEFEERRPLYDWFVDHVSSPSKPRQYEFGRMNLTYTVLSKRKLLQLVEDGHVSGWDDPRMPTLAGMRRRGYTPESILAFQERTGVSKRDGFIDVALLEHALREDLNERSPRVMAVLNPIKLVITNWPEGVVEHVTLEDHPGDASRGTRQVPFSGVVYVEQDDFKKEAPKKWWRLSPGKEVRLRGAWLVTCDEVIEGDDGEVLELRCTADLESGAGAPTDGRRVKGTIHWVSAQHAVPAEVRLYDRLFSAENPTAGDTDFLERLNPSSLETVAGFVEPSVAERATPGFRCQFERLGYFCVDPDSRPDALVLDRTITLRDSWAKIEQKHGGGR